MSNTPATVRTCIDQAAAKASRVVERAIDHTVEALEEESRRRDSPADRHVLADAVRELLRLRTTWCSRFPQLLRAAAMSPAKAKPTGGAVRPSSLTLVDDAQLMQEIEATRLAQQLAVLVEQPLAEFDALMSSALGLDGIQPEQNPLRPEVFAQCMRQLMGESQPDPAWTALWMRHVPAPMGLELKDLYRAMSELLTHARIQAADYRVTSSHAPLGPRASQHAELTPSSMAAPTKTPAAAEGPPTRGLSSIAELAKAIRGPRLRDFFSRGQEHAQEALPADYYARIEEELAAVQAARDEARYDAAAARQYEALPVVDRPVREVGTQSPLSPEAWGSYSAPRERSLLRTRLKKQAEQVAQAMGLEVVRQLVDQVAQDPRLLAPVREAIVALEPSLLRLALRSPQFFGEAHNPARRLVEAVAQRSFKYNDEFGVPFQAFFLGVRDRFNTLNQLEQIEDAHPFEHALAQLEAGWNAQDNEEEQHRRKVMKTVQLAEVRQADAVRIASELQQRSDLEGVPAPVKDFLLGPWAIVLAHARLISEDSELDPGGYLAVIAELLWSVKPEALRDPARAFTRIPGIVTKLRAGLDLIGHAPADSDSFFRILERLHRPVLKLRAKHRRQTLETATGPSPAEDEPMPEAWQPAENAEELWLAPEDLHACGFDETQPEELREVPAAQPAQHAIQQATARPNEEPDADAVIAGMRHGCWVDLMSKQRWHRAQLVWASARGTLFMFVSHGGQPHSMTRRSLQRLIAGRLLRQVEVHEVVQTAIETLAQPTQQPLTA